MSEHGVQVRGARLVERVLEATIAELARVGFGALSIEEIARRAEVNKTTIYRRWPTKLDLVRAASLQLAGAVAVEPDTGALRSDLIAMGKAFRDFLQSVHGQSLMRMMVSEGEQEICRMAREVRVSEATRHKRMVARAVARGELPAGTDSQLIVDALASTIQNRSLFLGESVTDKQLAQIVDLLLVGAVAGGAQRVRRAK